MIIVPAYQCFPWPSCLGSAPVQNVDPFYELVSMVAVVLAAVAVFVGWQMIRREMARDVSQADNSAGLPSTDSVRG